jgi:tetratricopeptide (TPR) repeat protein
MAESPSELRLEIEKLERKHAENPEGRYFVPLANAYRKLGAVEHAESLLRDGLRKHPEYLSAHIVLGRCLADRHATSEAAGEFRYVLSLDPQNLVALRTLGEMALADGSGDEAARWYGELLAVDPMNEEARRALEELGGVQPQPSERAVADAPPAGEVAPATGPDPETAPPVVTPAAAGWPEDEPYAGFAQVDLDEELLPAGEPAEEVPDEVVTETIAELYARQGFYERSAEVLRELIRRRGADPALQRRLEEVERLAARAGDMVNEAPDPDQPAFRPEPEALVPEPSLEEPVGEKPVGEEPVVGSGQEWPGEEDPFAASFAYGFGEAAAERDSPRADWRSEPIGGYLASLAGWSPGAPVFQAPAPEREPEPEPEPESAPEPEPEPAPEPLPGLMASEGAGAQAADEPHFEPGTTSAGDDELFPWEMPGDLQLDRGGDASSAAPAGVEPASGLVSFEDYLGGDAPPQTHSAPEPEPGQEPHPEPEPRREPQPDAEPEPQPGWAGDPEPAPAAEPKGEEAAVDGAAEDEDLESFQAWLRSLKR